MKETEPITVTTQGSNGDPRLVRYLLGRMGPEEQALLEEQYLADPQLHQELRAAERDLIDQYVHGELSKPEEFETHFLSSPPRRQRVAFARTLKRSFAAAPVPAEQARPDRDRDSWWRSPLVFFLNPSHRAWQAAAAALVILVGGGLLMLSWQRQNPQNPSGVGSSAENTAQPAPPAISPPEEPPRPEPVRTVPVATFVLTPSLTRDGAETATLIVEGDAEVRLQLDLETEGYQSYRARVRTAEGVQVLTQTQLKPERTASGQSVVVTLPASRLNNEDYTVTVSGVTAAGELEEVAGYYFRVQKR